MGLLANQKNTSASSVRY